MFKLSGEKLNLSSGMASAASTTCFSMALISRSTTEATVGEACCSPGGCCAWAVFAAVAPAARMSAADNKKCRLISVSPPWFLSRPLRRSKRRLVLSRRAALVTPLLDGQLACRYRLGSPGVCRIDPVAATLRQVELLRE